jgi:aerobic-type carbon monoxide dehydrogenase small subunit (CoxS/CutS family)
MSQRFSLNVNGKNHNVDVDPDMPLLYALRNDVAACGGTRHGSPIAVDVSIKSQTIGGIGSE